jgi:hypothetical protein
VVTNDELCVPYHTATNLLQPISNTMDVFIHRRPWLTYDFELQRVEFDPGIIITTVHSKI